VSEFFLLVRSVLQTYSDDSPYVRLDEWDGQQCAECGSTVGNDYVIYCHACDQPYCEECVQCCDVCQLAGCHECLTQSELSDRWVCERCIARCQSCGVRCADDELEDGCCDECRQQETEDNENPNTNKETTDEYDTQETHSIT
jgi:hypothetical protein